MKYIFIDSNQYRHLFSKNEGFSDTTKAVLDMLIEREQIVLLIPQQVYDEVERNRVEEWYIQSFKECESRIESKKISKDKKLKELILYPAQHRVIGLKIDKEILKEEKELEKITTRFRSPRSKANIKLRSLFSAGEIIDETDEIVSAAQLRLAKGNPPQDNKLGDVLIWESLITYLGENAEQNSTLIFVARDGDAWGGKGFNPWLLNEMKTKAGVEIILAEGLSDIEELTQNEQATIRALETQELKNNALSDFINSRSWVGAGDNARSLMKYKDSLNSDDYKKIVKACIGNNQIYGSFFTSGKLNYLCEGEDGYVVSYLESIDKDMWEKFKYLNDISLKRRVEDI